MTSEEGLEHAATALDLCASFVAVPLADHTHYFLKDYVACLCVCACVYVCVCVRVGVGVCSSLVEIREATSTDSARLATHVSTRTHGTSTATFLSCVLPQSRALTARATRRGVQRLSPMTLVGKDFSGLGGGLGMLGSEREVGGSEGCHDGAADSDTSRAASWARDRLRRYVWP